MSAAVELVARARGLSARLLSRSQLVELAAAPDLGTLARRLAEHGLAAASANTPDQLERELRAARADRMRLLGRWCGPRTGIVELVFGDEDRRSLRVLLRTLAAGTDRRQTLAGLVPTPALPEDALAVLAAQPSARTVASVLVSWNHPFGPPLLAAATPARRRAPPGLAMLEGALARAWIARTRSAARFGDRVLRGQVGWTIDVENLQSVLVGLGQPPVARTADAWVPGGEAFDQATYAEVLEVERPGAGVGRLREILAGGPLAELLDTPGGRIELSALGARIRVLARHRREYPLGTAPILSFVLRLRAEAADLRALVWGHALGRPLASDQLVTP